MVIRDFTPLIHVEPFIFELMYLKKADKEKLEATRKEAEKQIRNYLGTSEVRAPENLKAYVIVFVADKAEIVEEIEH